MTLVAVDVDYRVVDGGEEAVAAAVLFDRWEAAAPAAEEVARTAGIAPYEPGRFFARELPPLVAVLARVSAPLEAIVVDGYVWLGPEQPGLGAHLHAALGGRTPVIGVAKRPYRGAPAVEVLRGASARPLYVTTIGLDPTVAAAGLHAMHGPHRVPTLLARADRLCRDTR